jgi:hypothetical protein
MISAPVLLILKMVHEAEFVVATDASKVGIVGVILQEDTSSSLRPCAYWARKIKDCKTMYSAYDRGALAVVEAMSRVWRVYLLGYKHCPVFIDHAHLAHLLKQPRAKLTDRQVHWAERMMPFAHCMNILYRKGSVNEADVVSRRHNFFYPDIDVHLRMQVEMFALWWDGKAPDMWYHSNDNALLLLSSDYVSVDDGFLTKLKTAYSSCSYFANEKTSWKGYGLIKSYDGL